MSFELDIAGDFASVVDGLKTVEILDRDDVAVSVPNVLRRAVRTKEIAASNGRYLGADVVFHAPRPLAVGVGWKIVDADGSWTVLETGIETLTNRVRMVCRNFQLVYQLFDTVRLELATWTKNASGVQEPTWSVVDEELPCRLTYLSADNEVEHQLRNQPRQAVVYLEAVELVTESHRFVHVDSDENETILNIVSWADPESIDKLMSVNCEVVPWPLS